MFCRNCGAKLDDTAAFCAACGTKTKVESTSDVSPVHNVQKVQTAVPQTAGATAQNVNQKLTLIIIIVAIIAVLIIGGTITAVVIFSGGGSSSSSSPSDEVYSDHVFTASQNFDIAAVKGDWSLVMVNGKPTSEFAKKMGVDECYVQMNYVLTENSFNAFSYGNDGKVQAVLMDAKIKSDGFDAINKNSREMTVYYDAEEDALFYEKSNEYTFILKRGLRHFNVPNTEKYIYTTQENFFNEAVYRGEHGIDFIFGDTLYGNYTGDMENGVPNGKGTFKAYSFHSNYSVEMKGDWQNGEFTGKGEATYVLADGTNEHDSGDFKNGMLDGYGVQEVEVLVVNVPEGAPTKDRTSRYEGGFKENKFDGEGEYMVYWADGGLISRVGVFSNDKLVQGEMKVVNEYGEVTRYETFG